MTIYTKPNDPAVQALLRVSFPRYTRRGISINVHINVHETGGIPLDSYWSGGTRHTHVVVNLATMQTLLIPENGSGFARADAAFGPEGIPLELPAPGFAVVTLTEGSYHALAIHIHRDNAAKLLPAPVETTWAERVVLVATRSLKSSYAGRSRAEMAAEKTGITRAEWEQAKTALIGRRLLNAAGAITTEGRNAAGPGDLWKLKQERKATEVSA